MKTKLTLSIEQSIIEAAKRYARENGRSLSEMVENFFKNTYNKPANDLSVVKEDVPEYIRSLKGSLKLKDDRSYKKILNEAKDEHFKKKSLL